MDRKINNEIEAESVRVISKDGEQIGVLSIAEALGLAYSEDLDLVLLNDKQSPNVCQIMDYSKYKFEQAKKQKANKKKNKAIVTKEIILSCRIDKHDLDTKIKQIKKFLTNKNKVNISVKLKGREKLYVESAHNILEQIRSECEGLFLYSETKSTNDSIVLMILSPVKK